MRKNITRAITETTIHSAIVTFKAGVPTLTENKPIVIDGVTTEEKARKEVRKIYGNDTAVTNMVEVTENYEISVENFKKYGKKIIETPTPVVPAEEDKTIK